MTPRRAAKIDANQSAIVDEFRARGWSVLSLAAVGGGVNDLLIGRPGMNVLVEVKDGEKLQGARKLTPKQVEFHSTWAGPCDICTSVEEAERIAKFWHDRALDVHGRNKRSRQYEDIVPGEPEK